MYIVSVNFTLLFYLFALNLTLTCGVSWQSAFTTISANYKFYNETGDAVTNQRDPGSWGPKPVTHVARDNPDQRMTPARNGKQRPSTKVLTAWNPTDYRVLYIEDLLQNNLGATFHDARISNYTHVVFVPEQSAMYAVGNGVTIVKMDMNTFFLLDSYTIPQLKKPDSVCKDRRSCHESTEISVLSLMPNEQMVWYCYVHYLQFDSRPPQHDESGCMIPQHSNLAEPLVQWENPHFNSLDPQLPASILNAADGFTYISAFSPDYLRIFRTQMPDWNGKLNWSGALVTDKNRLYIADQAEILLTFETENEVYFVLRESPYVSTTHGSPLKGPSTATNLEEVQSSVARLIRICKGDRGGLPHVSSENFGTFAKSDIRCHSVHSSGRPYAYTRIQAAYWDNSTQRLFAVFSTEKWSPTGSALCIYEKHDIETSYNGPLVNPNFEKNTKFPSVTKNLFPAICDRFNSKNITAEEITLGRRLSLTFPHRYNPIEPTYKRAIIAQSGVEWTHIQAFDLPALPKHYHFGAPARATILWLGTARILSRIVIYEPPSSSVRPDSRPLACKLNELHVGQSLNVLSQPSSVADVSETSDDSTRRLDRADYLNPNSWQADLWRQSRVSDIEWKTENIRRLDIMTSKLFITTDRQILWLPLSHCFRYVTFDQCTESRDPQCGWSWHEARCVDAHEVTPTLQTNWFNTFSPSVDRRRVENAQCPMGKHSGLTNTNSWSDWYICRMISVDGITALTADESDSAENKLSRSEGFCRCRVCLNREECVFGTQEVTNCTIFEKNWLSWSRWTSCDTAKGFQARERICPADTACFGSSREQRPCSVNLQRPAHKAQANRYPIQASNQNTVSSRKVSLPTTWLADGVSVVLLLLVALLFLLLGCLVSTMLFCLFPSLCIRFDRNSSWLQSANEYSAREFCCKKRFTDSDTPSKVASLDSWSLPGTLHHRKSITKPTQFLEFPARHHKLPALPPKRTKSSNIMNDINKLNNFSTSFQQLLSGISLPSPTSIISGPSTASTVLKDKFTFENINDQNYDTQEEMLSSTTSKDLTETSDPSSSSYGMTDFNTEATTVQCLLCDSVELSMKTPIPSCKPSTPNFS